MSRRPSDEEVWLRAWCAAFACPESTNPARAAGEAVEQFRAKFPEPTEPTSRIEDRMRRPWDGVEPLYYVRDTRQVVGNCALWWAPQGQGYTCNLDEAGLYTAAECLDMRDTDVPYRREDVEAHAVRHVRFDGSRHPERAELDR